MPNVPITVTYNSAQNSLGFAPNNGNVTMDSSGTITFNKPPQITFTGIGFNPVSDDLSSTIDASGNLVVTDDDADSGTYEYTIYYTVNSTGQPGQTDPQIINRS